MDTEMSRHRKRTQEKKIIPPFLPGLEPILINKRKKKEKKKGALLKVIKLFDLIYPSKQFVGAVYNRWYRDCCIKRRHICGRGSKLI